MKKLFCLVAMIAAAVACAPKCEWKAEHVFVISFDGWGSYCMDSVSMPNTRALMAEGCYTFQKRTVLPSDSAPNWASMFAGAPVEFHGWSNNGGGPDVVPVYTNENGVFPTIFSILREQNPDVEMGCVYEWGGIKPLIDHKVHSFCLQESPEKLTETSISYILSRKPDFFTVIYDDPDHVGHGSGHDTPAYYAKMEELDANLGRIIEAIKEAGLYEDSIIIVTSDHGGINTGHGGRSLMEMDTPFIIAGKNVKKGGESAFPMMQYDVASTIAEIFCLETPELWRGKPMADVFE
jgi:predicted AlkP superfamily pyrophosphatase or phosphodiesterase